MSIVDIFCFEPVKAVKLKVSCEFIVFILGRGGSVVTVVMGVPMFYFQTRSAVTM